MDKLVISMMALFFCLNLTFAQKASDALEIGIPVDKGYRLFLKYDINDKALKVDAAKKDQEVDFTTLEDSNIFLVQKNAINIYLRPLNPLNYNYSTETKVVIDPINDATATALGGIMDVLKTITPTKISTPQPAGANFNKPSTSPPLKCPKFQQLLDSIGKIQAHLSTSKKDEIIKNFETLKGISFSDRQNTIDATSKVKDEIKIIDNHFKKVERMISETKKEVANDANYDCSYPEQFTAKFILNSILKDLSITLEEQKKRFTNLQTAYKLVDEMQEKASSGGGTDELTWCIPLNEVASKEGKITIYTVTIKESGYKLNDDKEIVSIESKELINRTIRIRKFQRFVPEVSVGTAFTFFKFNSYGTTSDSTGQQFVASPTENTVRNLNIATMINFNYYIPNSPLHPLYQIGVGVNSGIPTLLTGFGLRSNINGIRRLTISGGVAMTWIKELDKLKVGDKITGTDDIDKDLKFQFSWPPKLYIGLQYNF